MSQSAREAVVRRAAEAAVEAYNEGRDGTLRALMTKEMDEALPPAALEEFFSGLRAESGRIVGLDDPRLAHPLFSLVPARFERGVWDLKLSLDHEGRIAGFFIVPHTADIPVPERHVTRLSLPFKGRWLVFWGGETPEQNAHVGMPNQRHALDLLGVGADGKTRRGRGEGNEDYHCFGREVLAPADGVVTEAIDGVRDNAPGSMNQFSALGNAVVVEHAAQEVSVLAHLKNGGVRVKAGQRVRRGQVLGLCGNSGNSSEPHLHYHLQNTPVIQDGTGVKVRFDSVRVGGRIENDYSPVKGDVISPDAD